jgi:putative hydrolase of the HAD superfamily
VYVVTLPAAVLVDLDDTIVDGSAVVDCWAVACECCASAADAAVVLAEILRLREWFWSDAERHRRGRLDLSAARREIARMALENVRCADDALARRIAERYDECRDARTGLFPGAVETLRWLRDRGCRLALVTNGGARTQRGKIVRFGLEPLFDLILVEGELGFGKPDERIYRMALGALAASPHEACMIGDNLEWDVAQAQKLGMAAIWVDPAGRGLPDACGVRPDAIVRGLGELRGAFRWRQ